MTRQWYSARMATFDELQLARVEKRIIDTETRLAELTNPEVEEYRLDTGQTSMRERRGELHRLQEVLAALNNQRAEILCRIHGSGFQGGAL